MSRGIPRERLRPGKWQAGRFWGRWASRTPAFRLPPRHHSLPRRGRSPVACSSLHWALEKGSGGLQQTSAPGQGNSGASTRQGAPVGLLERAPR